VACGAVDDFKSDVAGSGCSFGRVAMCLGEMVLVRGPMWMRWKKEKGGG